MVLGTTSVCNTFAANSGNCRLTPEFAAFQHSGYSAKKLQHFKIGHRTGSTLRGISLVFLKSEVRRYRISHTRAINERDSRGCSVLDRPKFMAMFLLHVVGYSFKHESESLSYIINHPPINKSDKPAPCSEAGVDD